MNRRALFLSSLAALLLSAVGYSQTPAGDGQTPVSTARVTFAEAVAPIVYANCVTCHRPGEAAPFSLISYEDVAKRGALIARVTESRYMPPWHAQPGYGEFVGERRLTDAQIATIAAWVKQGMPRGEESKMPRLPEFPPDGWRLGQPDLVLEMPAFEVPASGPDVFRNFVIPTRLTEDRWVRGIEFRPSARRVVHHAIFAHVPGGSRAALDGADGRPGFGGLGAVGVVNDGADSAGLGGWAVGATPMMLPEVLTARLPKGSDFLLQMHFHPSGKVETERSLIGIYFADTGPDRDVVSITLPALFGFGAGIDIPPGEKRYTIQDSFTLPGDARVYMAGAHAHYLAREMKATATLPDGSARQLLWIHDWDFNWQDSYLYKEPFVLPKGTRVDVTLTYDNSADNPKNPISPPRRALFGEQSFDEMGAVDFTVEVLRRQDLPSFQQALGERNKLAIAAAGKDGTLGRFLARGARRGLQQITILDRQGAVVSRIGEPASYAQAAFSPDASRIAVVRNDPDSDGRDIWTFDVATGRRTAITSDAPQDSSPIWSPDGRHIAFVSIRDNTPVIYRRASDGTGSEELLYRHTSGAAFFLTDWSPDGRWLCFWAGDSLFVLPLAGDRTPVRLGVARGGRFSPDSRFLAFNASQVAGRFQVHVKSLDEATGQASALPAAQISTEGGVGGIFWRRDGKELFYLSQPPGQSVMAVDVTSTALLTTGAPKVLFRMDPQVGAPAQISSIASPDGQRFVFALNVAPRPASGGPPRPAATTAPATAAPAPAPAPAPATPAAPGRSPQAGLARPIVDELLRGFGGDIAALKRGLDAATSRLAESPDDPETLAWHGAALLSWARQGDTIVGFEAIVQNFQRATGQMNKAVSLQPDNPRVRMARGVLLQVETPGMPRFANHPGLVENAREDYQRLFDLRKDDLDSLGAHRLGELLQGLGDLYSRQGKADEAERFYRMMQVRLPGTEYAQRAGEWLQTKQPLPTPRTTCIGCHVTP
jgi:mono/diheme cytochrome c family protein/tetratricopeptide (TPR) repeat protein